jgi:hypothetical protein
VVRAGVTDNPVRLTRSVKDALTSVTCGGAAVYVWPGGGITFMVDVTQVPQGAFAVPTPALVAPIEFTLVVGLRGARWPHGPCAAIGVIERKYGNSPTVPATIRAGIAPMRLRP